MKNPMNTRRGFFQAIAAGGGAIVRPNPALCADSWAQVPEILKRIQPPKFPDRAFDVTRYGASPDGKKLSTDAIRQAIEACHAAGGGRVVVPAGEFLTGAIHLKSNVNLYLSKGSTLKFSQDPRHYLPLVFTRWEGVECMNYSPFIYAFEQENIGLTGSGTVDGQCDCEHWWPWKGRTDCGWKKGGVSQAPARAKLFEMGEKDVPVEKRIFGEGSYLRPQFIQPYRSKNVVIDGITVRNAPMYELHPVLCRNVTIHKVSVISHGPNTDGCDPECCSDLLIKDCLFDTGDDCIAVKSGRNRDGQRVGMPSENIVIEGCTMKDGHGGVTIGSEISGNARNIFAQNCNMDSPNLDRAFRFKNNAMRGGVIENCHMRNVVVGHVAQGAIDADFTYEEGEKGPRKPILRNISVRNLKVANAKYAIYLRGFKNAPIQDFRIEDCSFDHTEQANVVENVEGLKLSGVRINGKLVS